MVDYTPSEARVGEREVPRHDRRHPPVLHTDFSGINENAIRHDVLKLKELGFAGTLLVPK